MIWVYKKNDFAEVLKNLVGVTCENNFIGPSK